MQNWVGLGLHKIDAEYIEIEWLRFFQKYLTIAVEEGLSYSQCSLLIFSITFTFVERCSSVGSQQNHLGIRAAGVVQVFSPQQLVETLANGITETSGMKPSLNHNSLLVRAPQCDIFGYYGMIPQAKLSGIVALAYHTIGWARQQWLRARDQK